MSSLHDMISSFITLLMSAAFLHFGASGDAPRQNHPVTPVASRSAASSSSTWSAASSHVVAPESDDDSSDNADMPARPDAHPSRHATRTAHAKVSHRPCPRQYGGQPALNALRTPSPARRG